MEFKYKLFFTAFMVLVWLAVSEVTAVVEYAFPHSIMHYVCVVAAAALSVAAAYCFIRLANDAQ